MTDPWDEKPNLFVEKGEHDDIVYIGDMTFTTEDGDDFVKEFKKFDVWLEKLENTVSREWQREENKLRRIIVERGRKLIAVRKCIEERLDFLKDATDYECETLKIELEKVLKVLGPAIVSDKERTQI